MVAVRRPKRSRLTPSVSQIDHKVKHASADTEPAWKAISLSPPKPGLCIWRIEDFQVVPWPKEAYGRFYDGDSYIVLNASKPDLKSDAVRFDIHFWLGKNTSQDEAGTAAYKTVELDECERSQAFRLLRTD